MIEITITCSMCGKSFPETLDADEIEQLRVENLKERIEAKGWIVQINGDTVDTYCSKRCAK